MNFLILLLIVQSNCTMTDALSIAVAQAKHAFEHEFAIGKSVKHLPPTHQFRLGTLSLFSALSDLANCCLVDTQKRSKRKARINLICEHHPEAKKLPSDLRKLIKLVDLLPDDTTTNEKNTEEHNLHKLLEEITHEPKHINGVPVFETGIAWVPPASKLFHGFCTKTINQDGEVYELMTQIATVVLYRLLLTRDANQWSSLAKELISGAQIIFKGGVALGKFLFEEKPWWDSYTPEVKEQIRSAFIYGGDNDTNLHFANMKLLKKKYSESEINSELTAIAKKVEVILWDVCVEFDKEILQRVQPKSQELLRERFELGGLTYTFTQRKSSGFEICKKPGEFLGPTESELFDDFVVIEEPDYEVIGEKDKEFLCLYAKTRDSRNVFTTQSTVEYITEDKSGRVAFELIRAKLGFTAECDEIQITTYSELLDISVEYCDSRCFFKKCFVSV